MSAVVYDLRAYVAAAMLPVFGHDDGLRQIPVNEATKPSDDEVQQVRHALDLRAARLKREAKERERRLAQRQGFGFTPDGDAA